jgi:hypothetical protein
MTLVAEKKTQRKSRAMKTDKCAGGSIAPPTATKKRDEYIEPLQSVCGMAVTIDAEEACFMYQHEQQYYDSDDDYFGPGPAALRD